ncbi:MAG: type II toxin-antitoxin system RelE/ParE family toxin [Alphaproteobacteria bacterium]|nr:type II toxin-antitoxin system RelE/ParE family toxin [Alphaproteobacteria bacterium]MDE2496051.1 type II toxin-antitoxin system RelE/ParE family toxin [Alphaproteobacteria bacterium]
MAQQITISLLAHEDLDAIWDYLAAEASPEIADFVIARLYEAMNRAAENPSMYRETSFRGRPRRINVFEYAIFYEPLLEGGVFVLPIIHGRGNIARILRKPRSANDADEAFRPVDTQIGRVAISPAVFRACGRA